MVLASARLPCRRGSERIAPPSSVEKTGRYGPVVNDQPSISSVHGDAVVCPTARQTAESRAPLPQSGFRAQAHRNVARDWLAVKIADGAGMINGCRSNRRDAILLYLTFGRFDEAVLIMGTLPFALTGGVWQLSLMVFNQSVATGVGFIAVAGLSAEFGVVMLIYLDHALRDRGPDPDRGQVEEAVREGALLRVRPKAITVAVILGGRSRS